MIVNTNVPLLPHFIRYTYLFDLALRQGYPVLLVGPTGTGKTSLVARHLLGGGRAADAAAAAADGPDTPGGGGGGNGGGGAGGDGGAVGGAPRGKWQPVFLSLSARTSAGMAQEQARWGRGAGPTAPGMHALGEGGGACGAWGARAGGVVTARHARGSPAAAPTNPSTRPATATHAPNPSPPPTRAAAAAG